MVRRRSALAAACLVTLLASVVGAPAAKLGQRCGGFVGLPCDSGLWCEPPAGMCHGADLMGTCVKVGQICYQLYQPVCGCDGKTYGNDCMRKSKRIGLSHAGRC
jgi:hypothetical protein